MKIKAAVYARFSSHNQREESIDQQLRVCHRWADQNGYQIIKEFTDSALSGTTDKRPGFQQMIQESEKKHFEVLLVYSHDRFARNRYDAATYKAKLKKNGVRVIAVTMPLDDSPESTLMESVMEGFAEYYSKDLARKVSRGMEDNALNCKSNGQIPLGYKVENGYFVLDPVGAKAVQLIFDLFEADTPKAEIVRKLNEAGYRTRSGKPFVYNSIWRILGNEKYTGVYIYKDIRHEDGIPRIIEQDQWERVQIKLEHRKKTKGHSKGMEEYLLSGKLFCGTCGKPLVGESGKSGGNGQIYRYYKCSHKKHHGKDSCTKKPERKDDLETVVINYICENILTDENIKEIAAKAYQLLDEDAQDKSMLAKFEADYKETCQKIENILKAVEAGMFNPSMTERLSNLEAEKDELEHKIVVEKLKKPEFTQDHIEFYLQSFKGGHVHDREYVKGMIDSLINSVFVFDEDKEKGNDRKIVIALNLKNSPTATLKSSDILQMVDQRKQYPNCQYKKYIVIFVISN